MDPRSVSERLGLYLKVLKLPSFSSGHAELAAQAEREGWGFDRYLVELCERELMDRRERRIVRLLQQSRLPLEKTEGDARREPTPGPGAPPAAHALRGRVRGPEA